MPVTRQRRNGKRQKAIGGGKYGKHGNTAAEAARIAEDAIA